MLRSRRALQIVKRSELSIKKVSGWMLLLKLLVTPLFIAGATLAGRKYGPGASGWLVGLPLTAGPVALFLALEQGTGFASRAAQSTLLGPISVAIYVLAYCWCSLHSGWFVCWLCSWSVFFVVTAIFDQFSVLVPIAFFAVIGFLLVALLLLPREQKIVAKSSQVAPQWDLAGRMLAATVMVVLLTSSAQSLGPRLSGLLSPLPLFSTILVIFTHHLQGATAARSLLRGVVIGSFAYEAFFVIVTVLVGPRGILIAFSLALLGALLTQGSTLWILRGMPRPFSRRTKGAS
jgi:hypothetical protein